MSGPSAVFIFVLILDDVFKKFPDLNKIYDMFTLACHPDYRGRGIATEMVQQSKKVGWRFQLTFFWLDFHGVLLD